MPVTGNRDLGVGLFFNTRKKCHTLIITKYWESIGMRLRKILKRLTANWRVSCIPT